MKDIVFTARSQKRELLYLLISFVIAALLNLGATLFLYALTLIPRLLYRLLRKERRKN